MFYFSKSTKIMCPKTKCSQSCFMRFLFIWQILSLVVYGVILYHVAKIILFQQQSKDLMNFESNLNLIYLYSYAIFDVLISILVSWSFFIALKITRRKFLSDAQNSRIFWNSVSVIFSCILMMTVCFFGIYSKKDYQGKFTDAIKEYPKGKDSEALDRIQTDYFCCGFFNYSDWNGTGLNDGFPSSCAVGRNISNNTKIKSFSFPHGCSKIFINYKYEYIYVSSLGILLCFLAIFQSVGSRLIQTGEGNFRYENEYKIWLFGKVPSRRREILHEIELRKIKNKYSPDLDLIEEPLRSANALDALRVVRMIRENHFKPELIKYPKIN